MSPHIGSGDGLKFYISSSGGSFGVVVGEVLGYVLPSGEVNGEGSRGILVLGICIINIGLTDVNHKPVELLFPSFS